jgi:hypothetical protein
MKRSSSILSFGGDGAKLEGSFSQMRTFTANASPECRTPLLEESRKLQRSPVGLLFQLAKRKSAAVTGF